MARIPCAFSVAPELLEQIDTRAESLGLSRSGYIVQILRKDLDTAASELSILADPRLPYPRKKGKKKSKKR